MQKGWFESEKARTNRNENKTRRNNSRRTCILVCRINVVSFKDWNWHVLLYNAGYIIIQVVHILYSVWAFIFMAVPSVCTVKCMGIHMYGSAQCILQ